MNPTFKELANKAGLDIQHDGIVLTRSVTGAQALEDFARLVVEHCVSSVQQTNTTHAYTSYDLELIKSTIKKSEQSIKEHFGVEE